MAGLRKPNHRLGGLEVRICGKEIEKDGITVICQLPPLPKHRRHVAVASSPEEALFIFVKMETGDVLGWRVAEGLQG